MSTTTSTIRVLVVDDHPVVCEGVSAQLDSCHDIVVIGLASTGADAVKECAVSQPDVVLLDLRLPDLPAEEVVRQIHTVSTASRIVLFTAFPEHASVALALKAGATGLLVKDITRSGLCSAIHEVSRTGALTAGAEEFTPNSVVTAREYDILRLVAAGCTNTEIGSELYLSVNTVKGYLKNMMQKLSARNRTQLIMHARTRGLL
ncbi:response regulator transcription factor [Rhodococcus qingshengii]|uniref:response regulator transcription factor n=1 Tax=Rhodococcus qingshengii TaxID=334542 RepID=UPI0021BB83A8|nr:response regulator transcription factor [Rhodococcus qingshengii]UXF67279.1 response regulator transcription factor [Rhodococcus qingshengii]